ncbi:MAG: hypothetical protein LLF95_02125 [Bacteroidales bacterium]|nr:hypothetical protein [Bacteroidales bacterium]
MKKNALILTAATFIMMACSGGTTTKNEANVQPQIEEPDLVTMLDSISNEIVRTTEELDKLLTDI